MWVILPDESMIDTSKFTAFRVEGRMLQGLNFNLVNAVTLKLRRTDDKRDYDVKEMPEYENEAPIDLFRFPTAQAAKKYFVGLQERLEAQRVPGFMEIRPFDYLGDKYHEPPKALYRRAKTKEG